MPIKNSKTKCCYLVFKLIFTKIHVKQPRIRGNVSIKNGLLIKMMYRLYTALNSLNSSENSIKKSEKRVTFVIKTGKRAKIKSYTKLNYKK